MNVVRSVASQTVRMGTFAMRAALAILPVVPPGIFCVMEEVGVVHRGLSAISVGVHEVLTSGESK